MSTKIETYLRFVVFKGCSSSAVSSFILSRAHSSVFIRLQVPDEHWADINAKYHVVAKFEMKVMVFGLCMK